MPDNTMEEKLRFHLGYLESCKKTLDVAEKLISAEILYEQITEKRGTPNNVLLDRFDDINFVLDKAKGMVDEVKF